MEEKPIRTFMSGRRKMDRFTPYNPMRRPLCRIYCDPVNHNRVDWEAFSQGYVSKIVEFWLQDIEYWMFKTTEEEQVQFDAQLEILRHFRPSDMVIVHIYDQELTTKILKEQLDDYKEWRKEHG